MSQRPNEKRTSSRIPISMTVTSEELDPVGFGYAVNISEKGLRVDAQALVDPGKLPSIGTNIRLKFKLPSSVFYMSAAAQVVYIENLPNKSPQIGFSFLEPSKELLDEIKKFSSSKI